MTVATDGPEPDRDGYRVNLDGAGDRRLGLSDSTNFEAMGPGSHSVALSDMADCATADDSTRTVTVTAGRTEDVAFHVTCTATAALRVITRSEGAPAKADEYQSPVPGRAMRPIGANQSITMAGLRPGTLQVQLVGLAEPCSVVGAATSPRWWPVTPPR